MEDIDKIRHLTKEEVLNVEHFKLTVGDLKKFIIDNNIPDSAPILVQRIEDVYYLERNWGVYLKHTWESQQWIDSWDRYKPNEKLTQEECDSYRSGYTPASQAIYHDDDKEILFIDLHS